MEKRTRWSAAKAQELLAQQESSGQSLEAFCEERGWHPRRLHRWKRRFKTRGDAQAKSEASRPAFARVEVTAAPRAPEARSGHSPVLFELVLCTGQRLRFPAEVDHEVLSRTVRVLEVGSC